jgi:uncharacterized protein
VQNDFESNATVASRLSLLRQEGSRVTQGNLITLPVGGGLLYFEPVYVSQAAVGSSGSYPTLQDMLVYYNGQVGFAPTLTLALEQALGVATGQATTGGTSPSGHGAPASATVQMYLQQAETYYSEAQAALKAGDFAAYGSDLAKMKTALDNARKAAQGTAPAKPAPRASPSPSPRQSSP